MIEAFDSNADTPELIWDGSMRAELRTVLCQLVDDLLATRKALGGKIENYFLPPGTFVKYRNLEKELFIGGVYVSRFLKEPTFQLRDPSSFLEHLLQRWKKEMETYTSPSSGIESVHSTTVAAEAHEDIQSIITTAIVYLCKTRDTLCDKLAEWGHICHMLDCLNSLLHQKILGAPLLAVIRLIHVAASRMANVEALVSYGQSHGKSSVVSLLKKSVFTDFLHEDSAFMIEALKKIYEVGLGDVDKCRPGKLFASQQFQQMRPSASPGDGPIRKRVDAWDDPLAMIGNPQPSVPQSDGSQILGRNVVPNVGVNQNESSQLMQGTRVAHSLNQNIHQGSYALPNMGQPHVQQPNFSQSQPHSLSYQQRSTSANDTTSHYQAMPSYKYQSGYSPQQYNTPQMQIQQKIQPSLQYGLPHNHGRSHLQDQAPTQLQAQYQPTFQPNIGPGFQHQEHQSNSYHQYGGNSSMTHPSWQSSQQYGRTQGFYQTRSDDANYSDRQPGIYGHMTLQHNNTEILSQTSYMHQTHPSQSVLGQTGNPVEPDGCQISNPNTQHPQIDQNADHVKQGNFRNANMQFAGPSAMVPTSPLAMTDSVSTISDPTIPPSHSMTVETVTEQPHAPVQQYRPATVEGSGIDARTQEDPMIAAEQRAVSTTAAPNAAHGRVSLLQQALACELCEFLLYKVLENPSLVKIRDPIGAKVHSIALLKLLTKDPGFGPKFKLILSGLPEWDKYKSQDHSLLITGHEQKADYFLTDGRGAEKKFLTSS